MRKQKPKIKPRLMWAAIGDNGYIYGVEERKRAVVEIYGCYGDDKSGHVVRVLVTAPPRRKK